MIEVAGRVLASGPGDTAVLDDGERRIALHGSAALGVELRPGDLVRASGTREGDGGMRASAVERVARPTRLPFTAGSETGALIAMGLRERLVLRARVMDRVRAHMRAEGYLEVETPSVVTSPGLDVHLHAFEVGQPIRHSADADRSGKRPTFPPPATSPEGYLITSPEYHMKRLLVGGVARCFQLARCFRADESGRLHEPEFTMLEWYRAWGTMDDLLADTQAIVRAAASVGPMPGALRTAGAAIALDAPFERITVREAFERYAPERGDPIALASSDEDAFFAALVEQIEPQLGRERPTFLTRYPARHASLAKLADDDPTVCERAELYVGGVELCNGFVELTDPVEQRTRLERDQRERAARGLAVYPVDERFVNALEEGMPPSVGNAMGMDRLIALIAGAASIADVQAFARARR